MMIFYCNCVVPGMLVCQYAGMLVCQYAIRIIKNKIHHGISCSYIFLNFLINILFYFINIKRFYILLRIYTHYILPSKSGMIPSPLKTFNDNVSFTVVYLRCVSRTRRR